MAEEPILKIAVHEGGGPDPGYLFGVSYFSEARREAAACLNDAQYAHIARQFRELAAEADPGHPLTVDVKSIEDYHELRDKGGVLGKINFRAYFFIDKVARSIVVLGSDKKEEDGQTSQAIKIRMRVRLRRYRETVVPKRQSNTDTDANRGG